MKSVQQFRIHHLVEGHAQQTPEAVAIIGADNAAYSYVQYQRAIDEAAALLQQYGAQAGDRIVMAAENCVATAVFIFAASAIGAYIIPINARMTSAELSQVSKAR